MPTLDGIRIQNPTVPVGARVRIVSPCVDFNFFYGETGRVIRNSGNYLGIRVEFDRPRCFKNGDVQRDFNFNAYDLEYIAPSLESYLEQFFGDED